jgi:hypothetical protein
VTVSVPLLSYEWYVRQVGVHVPVVALPPGRYQPTVAPLDPTAFSLRALLGMLPVLVPPLFSLLPLSLCLTGCRRQPGALSRRVVYCGAAACG